MEDEELLLSSLRSFLAEDITRKCTHVPRSRFRGLIKVRPIKESLSFYHLKFKKRQEIFSFFPLNILSSTLFGFNFVH